LLIAQRNVTAAAARQFAADIAAEAYELPEWTAADHAAALEVINRDSDDSKNIGVTDAANVVLADRYRTTRLLTLDQRHFRRHRSASSESPQPAAPTVTGPLRRFPLRWY
jgi:predicted nucleic acid-binding protein